MSAARWEDMALVGRIARAHGIRGQAVTPFVLGWLHEQSGGRQDPYEHGHQ